MLGLVDGFWSESDGYIRRLLLDEAAGRSSGSATFEFDMFDVTLDFDASKATVADPIMDSPDETVELSIFLANAAAFEDDLGLGDGMTQTQRHPPTFRVDSTGATEPISGEDQRRGRTATDC